MVNLELIINNSGDSILEQYSYSNGVLTIIIVITEFEKKYKIMIATDCLSVNNQYLEKKEEMYRNCRIEIQELLNVLTVENGIFIPSVSFGKFMNETRLKYNLAYGKKSSESKYIFSLVGYDRLVSCLLTDLNCIVLEEI